MSTVKKSTIISVGIILLVGVFFVYHNASPKDGLYPQAIEVGSGDEIQKTDVKNNTFTHPRYGFSLTYPEELIVQRVKEGKASETILFQTKPEDTVTKGFQVFVTPYVGDIITSERLQKDIPNGDVRDQTEVIIGSNVHAMAFKSSIEGIGETRELWFIHDGFIYEFTTPIAFDVWLSHILKTITFIQ